MGQLQAKGRLRDEPPKLSATQETHLVGLYRAGKHITAELAELFTVGRFHRFTPWSKRAGDAEVG